MTANEARRHLRYSRWASDRLLAAVMAMPAQIRDKDLGASHKGVGETLTHVLFADHVWLERVTRETVERDWARVWDRWAELASAWSDADLSLTIEYKDMKGNPHRSVLGEIVMHVVNHGTLHRGQVMAMLRQLGVAPPPTDLIFFYREEASAAAG